MPRIFYLLLWCYCSYLRVWNRSGRYQVRVGPWSWPVTFRSGVLTLMLCYWANPLYMWSPSRQLSQKLCIAQVKTKMFGHSTFSCAAPFVWKWNTLPVKLGSFNHSIYNHLEATHLFKTICCCQTWPSPTFAAKQLVLKLFTWHVWVCACVMCVLPFSLFWFELLVVILHSVSTWMFIFELL